MSIQWGAFADVGQVAAHANQGKRLESRGIASLTPAEGLEALRRLFAHPRPEVGVVRFDTRKWIEFYPSAARSAFWSDLVEQGADADARGRRVSELRAALARASREEALGLLEQFLAREAGHVLRLSPARIERSAPFAHLGLDSLMTLELRNRIQSGVGVDLSAVILRRHDHIGALASYLLERLSVELLLDEVHASAGEAADDEDMESMTI
jgi:acyl carrier protein